MPGRAAVRCADSDATSGAGGCGGRWRRRLVAAVVVALVVSVGAPSMLPSGGAGSGWSLWGWLRGVLAPAAQAAMLAGPGQVSGTAKGAATHVPASVTRAGRGSGRPAGHAKGELPPYAPHGVTGKPEPHRSVGDGLRSFDPATSKRVASAASATQDVYANADGTYTRRIHAGRVNFKAASGTWTPIDTSLVKGAGGRFVEKANDVGVEVAGSADASTLVSVSTDAGHVLGFGLQGAAAVKASVVGDTATYASALPGVDVVESPTADGVKESLVLQSASAGSSWVFPLQLKGLTARMAGDGSVEFVDSTGAVRQVFPHGFMQDSKVDPVSGLAAMSPGVTYSLETLAGGPALRVSVDQGWLTDPGRVFPVTVDPTSSMGTSSSTYVETLVAGPHNTEAQVEAGTWDGGSHKARSFLAFTGFENTYAGQRMTSASLSVFDTWATNCTSNTTFYVGQVTGNWSSSTLATFPGPAIGGSTSSPAAIGSWTGKAPSVACGNTAGNRSVGAYITTGGLNVSTFNAWVAKTSANYGLWNVPA
jgi:hypothetical protein